MAQGLPVGSQPGQARGAVDTAWRDSGEPEPVVPVAFRLSAPAPIDVEGCRSARADRFVRRSAPRPAQRHRRHRDPRAGRHRVHPRDPARRRRRGRQQRLPRRADVPPPSGARQRPVPGLGPVPPSRRVADLPAAPADPRAALRGGCRRHGAVGPLRGEDDRRRVAARPRGPAVAGRLVPGPGARAPR